MLLDHTLGTAGICCDQSGAVMTPTLDLRIDHLGVVPTGRGILATASVYRATRRVLIPGTQ
jgi:acyl-coenzyme A thioesterase PaaI-like protein